MSRVNACNLLAAALSLALSVWLAKPEHVASAAASASIKQLFAKPEVVHEAGRDGLRDATDHFVPLAHYERIVSASSVADGVLLALCEPTRVLGYTRFSAEHGHYAYRYAGKSSVQDISKVEALIALKPDLVLVSNVGPSDRVQRLRELGLPVFDLGEMRGLRTLLPNILTIATLLGRSQAGVELAQRFQQRMRSVSAQLSAAEPRPGALYVSVYGDTIYGGTSGTSYHDVLEAAGLHDVAAGHYQDWPRYAPEALLALDPEVVVTDAGMARALCAHPGLDRLRVCNAAGSGARGQIVELDSSLLGDSGLPMLDAAESVFSAVHLRRPL